MHHIEQLIFVIELNRRCKMNRNIFGMFAAGVFLFLPHPLAYSFGNVASNHLWQKICNFHLHLFANLISIKSYIAVAGFCFTESIVDGKRETNQSMCVIHIHTHIRVLVLKSKWAIYPKQIVCSVEISINGWVARMLQPTLIPFDRYILGYSFIYYILQNTEDFPVGDFGFLYRCSYPR